jgi:carbon storage regulator
MLVIRRRAGQSLLIGESIEIEIIEVASTKVKLGIRAPKEIPVLRKEIKMTQEENQIAAKGLSSEAFQNLIENFRRT